MNSSSQYQNLVSPEHQAALEARRASEAAEAARLRRSRIAEGFAFSLVSSSDAGKQSIYAIRPDILANLAIQFTDALIAELDK
ncbi:hypothetical protein LJR231_003490 [Phyllobacterium sp. LjRoot231]|uniref:hypothetical protein n=1 Tax=Phyllobacterium sp. LjRoot231 TaxID=3342289 RepID=UPI003ECECAB7